MDGSMLVSPARAGTNSSPSRDKPSSSVTKLTTRRHARRCSVKQGGGAHGESGEHSPSQVLPAAAAAALSEVFEATVESQTGTDLKDRVEAWVARRSP